VLPSGEQPSAPAATSFCGSSSTPRRPRRNNAEEPLRLITTITDPAVAPAAELAALYDERWEFETTLGELKTQPAADRVSCSARRRPTASTQELYATSVLHYAIRWLMHTVRYSAGEDPDRLSFTRSLRAARRTTAFPTRVFPPQDLDARMRRLQARSSSRPRPRRSARQSRVVKRRCRTRREAVGPPQLAISRRGALGASRGGSTGLGTVLG